MVDIWSVLGRLFWTMKAMKKPCDGNVHANPVPLERDLPDINSSEFSMKPKRRTRCYVFMELVGDEDGRSMRHWLDIWVR